MIAGIPPRQTAGKFDTAYWEGFLSKDEIAFILSIQEWGRMETACIGGAEPNESAIDHNIRNGKVGWMHANSDTKAIWEKITQVIAEVNSQFFHFDLRGCYEPAQLTQYNAQGKDHYNWHIDSSVKDKIAPRKLSMSLLLSDPSEFQGGEFQIKTTNDEPVVLTQAKGRALFFPSYMLHRVTPVTSGVRKSLVLWVGGPEFR